MQIHINLGRGRTRPFVLQHFSLVSDEVREEVRQNPEQRQAANAICGENPGAAAFVPPQT
jgi:hypothetical protein